MSKKVDDLIDTNDKLEEYVMEKMKIWRNNLDKAYSKLSSHNPTEIVTTNAYVLSYKQQLSEETSVYMIKLANLYSKLKNLKEQKYTYYSTQYNRVLGKGEKDIYIDSDLSEYERKIQVLESYIEFLRSSVDNCKSFEYAVKAKVELEMKYKI